MTLLYNNRISLHVLATCCDKPTVLFAVHATMQAFSVSLALSEVLMRKT